MITLTSLTLFSLSILFILFGVLPLFIPKIPHIRREDYLLTALLSYFIGLILFITFLFYHFQ